MQEATELDLPQPDGGVRLDDDAAPAAGMVQAKHAQIAAATTAAYHLGYSLQVAFGVLLRGRDALLAAWGLGIDPNAGIRSGLILGLLGARYSFRALPRFIDIPCGAAAP